jgi:soluble lytic murein transglycosylase
VTPDEKPPHPSGPTPPSRSVPPPLPRWAVPRWRRLADAYRCQRVPIIAGLAAALLVIGTACVFCRPTRRSPMEKCRPLAKHYGQATGLDPALVLAVIKAESAGDPKAVSRSGARGLMQLMGPTAREVAARLHVSLVSEDDLFQPELNVRLGTAYLAQMRRIFDDDPFLYVAAYNCGPGHVARLRRDHPGVSSADLIAQHAPAETRAYVPRVLRYWDEFREEPAATKRP